MQSANVKMMNRNFGIATLALVAVSSIHRRAGALEPDDFLLFSWEPVTVKPQLALAEVHNDNLFYRPANKVSDWTTTLSPGLAILVGKRSDDFLTFNYTFNRYVYAERRDLDSSEHLFEFGSNLDGQHLSLRGTDRVQFLSSPVGNESKVLDPQAVDRPVFVTEANIDRTTFYDSYMLSYRPAEKAGVYLRGTHSAIDYETGVRLFDYRALSLAGGFAYQAFPKATLFGEGYFGNTTSQPNLPAPSLPSIPFFGGAVGARGTFTPKITGTVQVGIEVRDFKSGPSLPPAPVANLGLSYRLSEKTTLSLNYVRRQDVSVYYQQQSYTSDVISLQASQALGSKGKWRATLGGYYAMYNYDTTTFLGQRDYDVYTINFSLAYQIQLWLTASLGLDRTSVLEGGAGTGSYDVNRMTLRLAIGY